MHIDHDRLEWKLEKGFEKGLHEGMTTVAVRLIANGLSNAAITEITGLSDAEIDKLRTMH